MQKEIVQRHLFLIVAIFYVVEVWAVLDVPTESEALASGLGFQVIACESMSTLDAEDQAALHPSRSFVPCKWNLELCQISLGLSFLQISILRERQLILRC